MKQLVRNKWISFTVSVSKNDPRIKDFEKLLRIKKQLFWFIDSNQWIKKHFIISCFELWIKNQFILCFFTNLCFISSFQEPIFSKKFIKFFNFRESDQMGACLATACCAPCVAGDQSKTKFVGLKKNRSCTDIICCFIYFCAVVGFFGLALLSYLYGKSF